MDSRGRNMALIEQTIQILARFPGKGFTLEDAIVVTGEQKGADVFDCIAAHLREPGCRSKQVHELWPRARARSSSDHVDASGGIVMELCLRRRTQAGGCAHGRDPASGAGWTPRALAWAIRRLARWISAQVRAGLLPGCGWSHAGDRPASCAQTLSGSGRSVCCSGFRSAEAPRVLSQSVLRVNPCFKMVADGFCPCRAAKGVGEFFQGGLTDPVDRAEAGEELFPEDRADPGDVLEL